MKKIVFSLALLLFGGLLASAQKYGHLNFGNLVASMPAVKTANSDLEAYQKELIAKGEEMAKSFQEKYGKFVTDVQSGDLSPVQQQTRQQELQKEQQDIINYEREINEKVQAKRQELLSPIVEQAEKAIAEVAKANGYLMVFDTSSFNTLLFAEESDDLYALVRAKLGLPAEEKKD